MDDSSLPVRILVVDDEPTIRHLLKRWIARSTTAQVVEAENGLLGLEKLSTEKIDLVISDLNMPVLDGIEMLSLIRADPAHSDLELMVASTVGNEAKIREVISLGVSDYLLKPLQLERVVACLEAAEQRVQERRRRRSAQAEEALTRVLIADADPNFCEFAVAALSTRFSAQAVRTTGELLVKMLRFEPDCVLISPKLAGSRLSFLLEKMRTIKKESVAVYLLLDSPSAIVEEEGISGTLPRTFVPETFLASVVQRLSGGPAPAHGILSWIPSLGPEIRSALRQALGMMTGAEPVEAGPEQGLPEFALFGQISLESARKDFMLSVEMRCEKAFARGLVVTMLGGGDDESDDETLASGLREILNVVAGRIKNSCSERGIEVALGLRNVGGAVPAPPRDILHEKEMRFVWAEKHLFQLTFYGCTLRQLAEGEPKSEGATPAAPPEGAAAAKTPPAAASQSAPESSPEPPEAPPPVEGGPGERQ